MSLLLLLLLSMLPRSFKQTVFFLPSRTRCAAARLHGRCNRHLTEQQSSKQYYCPRHFMLLAAYHAFAVGSEHVTERFKFIDLSNVDVQYLQQAFVDTTQGNDPTARKI